MYIHYIIHIHTHTHTNTHIWELPTLAQSVESAYNAYSAGEKWKWSHSVVSYSLTPWTVACQAPPSMGFSRQEYWGDLSSIPGSVRSPGEGNGNPLQYSCLENPLDREAWQSAVHGVARTVHDLVLSFFLSIHTYTHTYVIVIIYKIKWIHLYVCVYIYIYIYTYI